MAISEETGVYTVDHFRASTLALYRAGGSSGNVATVEHMGVSVSSRYGREKELSDMMRALDLIGRSYCVKIDNIFCDSKACAIYTVEVRDWYFEQLAPDNFPEVIADAISEVCGGFNGLSIVGAHGFEVAEFGTRWDDER